MVKVSDFFGSRIKDGVLLLETKKSDTFFVLGTSIPNSLSCDAVGALALPLEPEKGKDAIVAVSVKRTAKASETESIGLILQISWRNVPGANEPEPFLEDEVFIPKPGRLGKVWMRYIEVVAGGNKYTSNNYLREGEINVADTHLLCKYLMGEANIEELDAASYVSTQTVSQLQTKLDFAEGEIDKLKSINYSLRDALKASQLVNAGLYSKIHQLNQRLQHLVDPRVETGIRARLAKFFRPVAEQR